MSLAKRGWIENSCLDWMWICRWRIIDEGDVIVAVIGSLNHVPRVDYHE